MVVEIIQAILLLISSILILIAAYGLLKLDKNMDNVLYVRIHILGLVDIGCIIAFIALNEILLGLIYLILAPFVAHAISNAFYHSEDENKKLDNGYQESNVNLTEDEGND